MSEWLIAYLIVAAFVAFMSFYFWGHMHGSDNPYEQKTARQAAIVFLLSPLWLPALLVTIGFALRALVRDALGKETR